MGCSERYVHEVFVRDVGLPPKVWIRGERMVKARKMLAEGAASADVAEKLGFSDCGVLRREFSTVYGMNPAEYVKKRPDDTVILELLNGIASLRLGGDREG